MLRNTPRGKQAVSDARLEGDGVPNSFSEAFGLFIGRKETPEIFKLILKMREGAGDLATRESKDHYMRPRPFSFFSEPTCTPDGDKKLSSNGSYPSGHTSIG